MGRRRRLNLAVVVQTASAAAVVPAVISFLLVSWLGPGVGAALVAAGTVVVAVAGAAVGFVFLRLREGPRDAEVVAAYLPVLRAEWSQVAEQAARLPAADAPPEEYDAARTSLTEHLRAAERSLFDEAEPIRTAAGITRATGHIAEARHLLAVLDALGRGEPRPHRGAPCFFDPAHGPLTSKVRFNPEGGADRTVPVCDACRARLEAGEVPPSRQVAVGGRPTDYWRAGWVSVPYVDGYWQERRFPDHGLHRLRRGIELTWDASETEPPAHLDREPPWYSQ
ncbi:hypothetical protein SUDANB121_03943 [Nocardiopsis dassonvillei]|uniref:hypothetical protein n=1 Tax=Nocardiopsis dassonvillei TaxID=2014 RepID=UPI003F5729E6